MTLTLVAQEVALKPQLQLSKNSPILGEFLYTLAMYIKVRVVANAKRESVKKVSATSYTLSVKEPAKQNLANRRVVELIAIQLGVPKEKVRIINGHQSPSKLLSILE